LFKKKKKKKGNNNGRENSASMPVGGTVIQQIIIRLGFSRAISTDHNQGDSPWFNFVMSRLIKCIPLFFLDDFLDLT